MKTKSVKAESVEKQKVKKLWRVAVVATGAALLCPQIGFAAPTIAVDKIDNSKIVIAPRVLDRVLARPDLIKIRPRFSRVNFYKLQASQLNRETFKSVGAELRVRSGEEKEGAQTVEDESGARGFFVPGVNAQLVVLPDLSKAKSEALPSEKAIDVARKFIEQNDLAPREELKRFKPEVSVWSRNDVTKDGGEGQTLDVIRSIRFVRQFDGLEVVGPSSMLSVNVDDDDVVGASDYLRPLAKSDIKPVLRPMAEIEEEFRKRLDAETTENKPETKISKPQLVYLEQGKDWVQPAYRYDVEFIYPNDQRAADVYFVQAASNSPERIEMEMDDSQGAPTMPTRDGDSEVAPSTDVSPTDLKIFKTPMTHGMTDKLEPTSAPNNAISSTRSAQATWQSPWKTTTRSHAQAGGPIKIGLYINRQDNACWLNDANEFMGSLNVFNVITGRPTKERTQYFWNHEWLWHAAGGVSDQSTNYAGKVNMAMIEGHGAPWIMTTLGNGSDVLHVNQFAGFGGNRAAGQKTNYLVFHSCSLVPRPGSPFGADYTSGSAFDAWWGVFKGMRGAYGYHVTMYICDGVGGSFGTKIGLGVPNLAAWLDSTANNRIGHPNGFGYGSAVIVSGRENDRLYDTGNLPNPSNLTMWWNHA